MKPSTKALMHTLYYERTRVAGRAHFMGELPRGCEARNQQADILRRTRQIEGARQSLVNAGYSHDPWTHPSLRVAQ